MKRKWLIAMLSISLAFVCTFSVGIFYWFHPTETIPDNPSASLPEGPSVPGDEEDPPSQGNEDENKGETPDPPDDDPDETQSDEIIDENASRHLAYTLSDDGASYYVSGIGTCTDTELIISSTYNGLPVTQIYNAAFDGCTQITSVIIPEGVTRLGDSSFRGCSNLSHVSIPDSVTFLSNQSFTNCTALHDLQIPDSVTYIGRSVFDNTAFFNDPSN